MIDIQRIKQNNDVRILAARHTELEKKTAKEMGGACPRCGGTDRFYCQAVFFACRQCHPQHGDVIELVQWVNGLSFLEACNQLDGQQSLTRPVTRTELTARPVEPDHSKWEARATTFVTYAEQELWNNSKALDYLFGRGFTETTIKTHRLGYNPKAIKDKADNWNLIKDVWIPPGWIIPTITGQVKNIKIKTNKGWRHIAGGQQLLYLVDDLNNQPVVMCEAELDALSVKQEVGEVAAVAVCGASANRRVTWIAKLVSCERVILAFDADEAGDKAAEWWLNVLGRRAVRLRPTGGKDANEMLQAGLSLRDWVLNKL